MDRTFVHQWLEYVEKVHHLADRTFPCHLESTSHRRLMRQADTQHKAPADRSLSSQGLASEHLRVHRPRRNDRRAEGHVRPRRAVRCKHRQRVDAPGLRQPIRGQVLSLGRRNVAMHGSE